MNKNFCTNQSNTLLLGVSDRISLLSTRLGVSVMSVKYGIIRI